MEIIKFIYLNKKYRIKLNEKNITIHTLIIDFISVLNKNVNELYFIYKGKYLSSNDNRKINELKDKNINIFVFNLNTKKIDNENKELKHVICPLCQNLSIITNNNDLFSFNTCIYNHKLNDFTINAFIENQYIDESKIKCDICKNNKIYYDKFYIYGIKKYICPLCAEIKKNQYNIIDYNDRFSICNKHKNKYISYCKNCRINLCDICENEHKNHKIKIFKEIKPNNKRIEEIKIEEMKINKYKEELKN